MTATRPVLRGASAVLGGALVLVASMSALAAAPPSSMASRSAVTPDLAALGVLGGAGVNSRGATVVNADVGVGSGAAVLGFPPGIVNGTVHAGDPTATAALALFETAYADLAASPATGSLSAELGGVVLAPGTYGGDAASLTGQLTLDGQGDPNAAFVLQVDATLQTHQASSVVLVNGAEACHVSWQVGGTVDLAAGSSFVGSVLSPSSITVGSGATVDGRVLTGAGSVALDSARIVQSSCTTPEPEPTATPTPSDSPSPTPTPTETEPPSGPQPNVVFVLVDDFSENLLPYMTEVQALQADGVRFQNFVAATPWCCPSRATYQSGKYPHNTGVRSNTFPAGGFEPFLTGDMTSSVGVQMQANGYRTGMLGKYLNGYKVRGQQSPDAPFYPSNFVPPGWDSWFSGTGYQHFAYQSVESVNGSEPQTLSWRGQKEGSYYTDVLSGRAQTFLTTDSDDPFFLMLTPFAPHKGVGSDPEGSRIKYPPAPRDRALAKGAPRSWEKPEFTSGDCGVISCLDVPWPDTSTPGNFNLVATNPLPWMAPGPLSEQRLADGRRLHVQRIQMIQSVNDMLRGIRETLAATGHADDTYVVFGADNGYHLGEHALFGGKTTAYDHDVRVPLIVRPPGGTGAPITVTSLVQNTDVVPTLVDIAGGMVAADTDGASMLPLLRTPELSWRVSALLELTNDTGDGDRRNPDVRGFEGDHVAPTYNALRTERYLYVDYSPMDDVPPGDGQAEWYGLDSDPDQTQNRYPELSLDQRAELNAELLAQVGCSGASCWAEQVAVPTVELPLSRR